MEKYLLKCLNEAQDFVQNRENLNKEQRELARKTMLTRISFIQQERLIHLIVTCVFAIILFISIILLKDSVELPYLLLTLLILVLLIPYIRHYYILENGVQKLYSLYESFTEKRGM